MILPSFTGSKRHMALLDEVRRNGPGAAVQARRLAEVAQEFTRQADKLMEERNSATARAEAAEAKAARLGRKLGRLGQHLAETRKKLRKVEVESATANRRLVQSRQEHAQDRRCRSERTGELERMVKTASLAATEAPHE